METQVVKELFIERRHLPMARGLQEGVLFVVDLSNQGLDDSHTQGLF